MRLPPPLASSRVRGMAAALVLIASGALALASGAAVGTAQAAEGDAPASVARRYVDAIAAGDATTANRLARVPAQRQALLTDAVLGQAERIRVQRVLPAPPAADASGARDAPDAREGGPVAAFSVSYLLSGRPHAGRVEVARGARGWHVSRGLATAVPALPRTDSGVGLRGAAAPLKTGALAYPGRYALTPGKRLFELSGDATLTVDGRASFGSGFAIHPSRAFAAEVQHAVEARLAQCAALTSFDAVVGCGIALDEPHRVDPERAEVTVTLVEPPHVEVAPAGESSDFVLTGGRFSARVRGPASGGRSVETVAGYVGDLRPEIGLEEDHVRVGFAAPPPGGPE